MNTSQYLQHYGILGMKWGIRRYQNEDGTLTEEGKKRYSSDNIGQTAPKLPRKKMTNEEVILSTNPQTVLDYQRQLSTKELGEAYERMQKVRSIQNLAIRDTKPKYEQVFEDGAKYVAKATVDAAAQQATAAIRGGVAYGGQALMSKILSDAPELSKYVVGSMKGSGKKNKGK